MPRRARLSVPGILSEARCSTIAFDAMQKSVIKYRLISLSSFTPTVKWQHNLNDLPVH